MDQQPEQTTAPDPQDSNRLVGDYQALVARKSPARPGRRTSLEDEITRREKIQNDDAEQDIKLKRRTLSILFGFLTVETAVIFWFTFLQATKVFGFQLNEWSFKLVVSATLAQITGMVFVAVNYLFPKKK